jgi:choline dehydrogenase
MAQAERAFDVIVAGGGTAGCVVASRLSEDPDRRVLLLEGGPDFPDRASLPPDVADGAFPTTEHDWGYRSQPDPAGRSIPLPRGRLMGGCSATNACVALRACPADFEHWAALGNEGWSFDKVLPFFVRCETDRDFPEALWHGSSGPLPIRRSATDELAPSQAAALEAAAALGYPAVDDHNRPGAIGAGLLPVNRIDGLRMSTAVTYLAAARARPNLTVMPDTLIDRVEVEGRTAVGVRLGRSEELVRGDVVVLSAGAYGSPAVLMRSGVGPTGDLSALGIRVIQDLPGVGENLIDHAWLSVDVPASPNPPPAPLAQGMVTLLADTGDHSAVSPARPDLQLLPCSAMPAGPSASPTGARMFVGFSVVSPRSRGRLRLRSPDPAVAPLIDPAHLRDPHDLSRALEGLRRARQLLRTAPLSDFVAGPELTPAPGIADDDEAGLAGALRATANSYHHPVGTCRMGPEPSDGAVVDARGRVYGIDGLWIADASIMPDIPAANTNLTTVMIGERIASVIAEAG